MCDACNRFLDRRALLRGAFGGAVAGGAAAALWLPAGRAVATDAIANPTGFETAAMADDTMSMA
ncbi:MAG TPA: hypothetical protein VGM78_00140, partial [Ilumatobacteraceae bacterium]